ncbi:hypothetical protein [Puniceibacterium antarcticum]|uniref:hypothetical protein n=1 Tax=Puniceibacterium antarcticum TaxID=1206336 RepID=UPI001C557FFB|nr:hypothetical protein [Puniceibacterium antarcticum]
MNETEWRLGGYVVPQLLIVSPIVFLAQLEDEEWVIEKAEDFSQRAPSAMRTKLSICDARLSFGGTEDEKVTKTDQGTFVVAGWTEFDPAHPQARILFEGLARRVDGIFEDNTSGIWWAPI